MDFIEIGSSWHILFKLFKEGGKKPKEIRRRTLNENISACFATYFEKSMSSVWLYEPIQILFKPIHQNKDRIT